MINPRDIQDNINKFFEHLYYKGLVLDYRYHDSDENGDITKIFSRGAKGGYKLNGKYVYVFEYIKTLTGKNYSLLLNDGGIVQISFDIDSKGFREYRFFYFPCPTRHLKSDYPREPRRQDPGENYKGGQAGEEDYDYQHWKGHRTDRERQLQSDINSKVNSVLKHLCPEKMGSKFQKKVALISPIRFEWKRKDLIREEEEKGKRESYAASHVHLGFSRGRLTVANSITIWQFLCFVFKHFYHEEFSDFEALTMRKQPSVSFPKPCSNPKVDSEHKKPFYIHIP